ncbi:hypothetical protein ACTFIY_003499 [Dictyostelium cf. discoideum]
MKNGFQNKIILDQHRYHNGMCLCLYTTTTSIITSEATTTSTSTTSTTTSLPTTTTSTTTSTTSTTFNPTTISTGSTLPPRPIAVCNENIDCPPHYCCYQISRHSYTCISKYFEDQCSPDRLKIF